MKKVFCLILALTMLLPMLPALAEGSTDIGVIGGADGPTALFVGGELKGLPQLIEDAIASGRQVVETVRITEFSGIDLGSDEMKQAVADLLDALVLVASSQGDENSFKLQIGGQDVLSLGVAVSDKDTYINSNLLGNTIVISEDEASGVITRLLDMLVKYEMMTEDDAESMRQTIEMLPEMLESQMPQTDVAADLNWTALQPYLELIENKAEVIADPVVPKNCDAAAAGMKAVFTEDDVKLGVRCIYQFLLDNPSLMDLLGQMFGMYTEAQVDMIWQESGEFYVKMGMVEDEAAFRALFQTMESVIKEAMNALPDTRLMEGDCVMAVYTDEEGLPVYITAELPLYVEGSVEYDVEGNEVEIPGYVEPISLTYARQTLADSVDHVCSITADGITVCIDVRTAENSFVLTVDGVYEDGTVVKVFDFTATVIPGATENDPGALKAEMNFYNGETDAVVLRLALEGECLNTETRSYLSGKLTAAEGDAVETFVIGLSYDTAISGVDFSGTSNLYLKAGEIGFAMDLAFETADPVEAIMAGQVTRLAELDDTTFENWFVSVKNGLNVWLVNLMNVLPASVLQLMFPVQ